MRTFLVFIFCLLSLAATSQDYMSYFARCRVIEEDLLKKDWQKALLGYEKLVNDFDFVYLKEQKIALQLAYRLGDSQRFGEFSNRAFAQHWKWKSAKKTLRANPDFKKGMRKELKNSYRRAGNTPYPNPELRTRVKKLFFQDQWQAFGALFTFSSKRRESFAEKKFAPKAIQRVAFIQDSLETRGYPGEQLIGNSYWASTILSHYNSMSLAMTQADTLFPKIRKQLQLELEAGRISSFEFAVIDNWYQSVKSERKVESYGILEGRVSNDSLEKVNRIRVQAGLPTVERYNALVALQEQEGIRLFFGESWGGREEIVVVK